MGFVSLAIFLLVVAVGLGAVVLWFMALSLLQPPRMTDGKALYVLQRLTPSDLGLAYETQHFDIRDEATSRPLRIAGWWIPASVPSETTVIAIHGYSDAKVGGIAWAPTWHALGVNVLAIDLRAHGESGGRYSTAGYFERHDVEQVIDLLRKTKPRAAQQVVLFGVSLGAAVAAAVGVRRDDLAGVVLESPYTSYRDAIDAHGRRLAMPLEHFYGIAYRLSEWISGARFDEVRPVDLIPKITAPLLVFSSGADTFISVEETQVIAAAVARRPAERISRHIVIPDAQHTRGLLADPIAYREYLAAFLAAAIASPSPARLEEFAADAV